MKHLKLNYTDLRLAAFRTTIHKFAMITFYALVSARLNEKCQSKICFRERKSVYLTPGGPLPDSQICQTTQVIITLPFLNLID